MQDQPRYTRGKTGPCNVTESVTRLTLSVGDLAVSCRSWQHKLGKGWTMHDYDYAYVSV